MSQAIVAALLQLDPANDQHWTKEGAPSLDAVKLLSGDDGITRALVTAAAPKLLRAGHAAWSTNVVESDPAPTVEYPIDDLGLEGEDLLMAQAQELDSQIEAQRKECQKLQLRVAKAQGEYNRAEAALDAMVEKRSREFPPANPIHTAQEFIRSQHEARMVAAGLRPGSAGSQLDADMRTKRPTSTPWQPSLARKQ